MNGPALAAARPTRRALGAGAAAALFGASARAEASSNVNRAQTYARRRYGRDLTCVVDPAKTLGPVDRRIFGTNLEWFNDAGGLGDAQPALRQHLVELARAQRISVFRFPGGTLADYYDWRDGIGPAASRPRRRHPTDPGQSDNGFGTPEFFRLLRETAAQGLITVNAGTSTPQEAAAWVAYANRPGDAARRADGFAAPAGIKLWEVGNELYLPGNPGERKITVAPDVYAARFIRFADAMRKVDESISVIAIGVAKSHIGPDTEFADWSERLLAAAADRMDMIAVHNAYFPLLYGIREPPVERVYPALWAAPEAVSRSLAALDTLIARHEKQRRIGIAITEWGALFSLPDADPYWVDHVKTIGAGIYLARLMQVLMEHPRVQLANYFKLTDRSFMGWIGFDGMPKVPYWVFRLYAEATGSRRVAASVDGPTYDAPALGAMAAESAVPEVTVVATRNDGALFVNLVNRSMANAHRVRVVVGDGPAASDGELRSVSAHEPTAHNGIDIPPEWPMRPEYEPYTTAAPGSIRIESRKWSRHDAIDLPPFSVATLILNSAGVSS